MEGGTMTIPLLTVVSRLLLATLLGGLIGLEREAASRGAGARTHALVALGAALFTVAGAYGFGDAHSAADPSRIAAQVAAGVGFIGAGAVIRNGSSVSGVTTAATVWLAAAGGPCAAAGVTVPAIAATGLALVVLVLLRAAQPVTGRLVRRYIVVEVDYERGHGTLGPLLHSLDELDARIGNIHLEDDGQAHADGVRHVAVHVSLQRGANVRPLLDSFTIRPEVRRLRLGESKAT